MIQREAAQALLVVQRGRCMSEETRCFIYIDRSGSSSDIDLSMNKSNHLGDLVVGVLPTNVILQTNQTSLIHFQLVEKLTVVIR